jgi:hypothetical protein
MTATVKRHLPDSEPLLAIARRARRRGLLVTPALARPTRKICRETLNISGRRTAIHDIRNARLQTTVSRKPLSRVDIIIYRVGGTHFIVPSSHLKKFLGRKARRTIYFKTSPFPFSRYAEKWKVFRARTR